MAHSDSLDRIEQIDRAGNSAFNGNIPKFYVGAVLGGFSFFYNAIDTLYYRNFGLSFQQIGWMISASLIATLLLEIPTGAFADLYGKKKAMVIAAICNLVATALIALGGSFPLFLAGFIFWGVERAFSSGASSALFFDTLRALGREKEFLTHSGRLSSFFISIDVISGALAPLLFAVNIRLPYFVSLGAALAFVMIRLSLYEAPAPSRPRNVIRENVQHITQGIQAALQSKIFLWLSLFNILILTADKALGKMILTPFLIDYVGFTLPNLSIILVVGSLMQAAFVFFADRLDRKLGDKRSFLLIVLAFPITTLFYAISRNFLVTAVWTGICFSIVSFSQVVVANYMNHTIPDDKRATILSFNSMLVSTFILVSLPGIGAIVDKLPLQHSILLVPAAVLLLGLALLSQYKGSISIPGRQIKEQA